MRVLAAILLFSTLLLACSDDDAFLIAEPPETPELLHFPVSPEGVPTSLTESTGVNGRTRPDEKLWATQRECFPHTINWTMQQGPYKIEERASEPAEFPVSDWIQGKQTGPSFRQHLAAIPHPSHHAGMAGDGPFSLRLLHAKFGEDVRLSVYHWAPTIFGKLGELGLTVLVNYQPTQASFTHWDEQRVEIVEEFSDTGFYKQRRSNIHGIDIRIPAATFKTPGAYHISVVQKHHVEHRSEVGYTFRFTLLYGGYTLKETICVRDALTEPASDFEKEVGVRSEWLVGAFERESLSDERAMGPPDGGVWIDWSVFRRWFGRSRIVAIVPLVDFRPVAPPTYTWSGGFNGHEDLLETVDDRGSVWVPLDGYEKKDLMLAVFPDPFLPIRNLDGEVFYEVNHDAGKHSRVISISSYRDDSDKCDALAGPCVE